MEEFVLSNPILVQCLHSITPQLKSSSWMEPHRSKAGILLLNPNCFPFFNPHYSNKTHNNTLHNAGNSPLPSYLYLRLIV